MLGACDKKDPILPGERIPVFHDSGKLKEKDARVGELIGKVVSPAATNSCTMDPGLRRGDGCVGGGDDKLYIMSDDNVLTRKSDGKIIFRGFPTAAKAGAAALPIVSGKFIFIGLSTGEVLKINKDTGEILWSADLGGRSLLTGGSLVSDISVLRLSGGALYAASLGGVLARIDAANGDVVWTANIGTIHPIFISGRALAVIDSDKLIVLDSKDGVSVKLYELSRDDYDTIELDGEFWKVSNSRRSESVRVEE
ncbi:MAG: PQQ-like beta-propeller repeat protein [Rickettsiales bacterium]|nr:PQQ-like beta-propeller repeat protein [Rickettsiales bacterium]